MTQATLEQQAAPAPSNTKGSTPRAQSAGPRLETEQPETRRADISQDDPYTTEPGAMPPGYDSDKDAGGRLCVLKTATKWFWLPKEIDDSVDAILFWRDALQEADPTGTRYSSVKIKVTNKTTLEVKQPVQLTKWEPSILTAGSMYEVRLVLGRIPGPQRVIDRTDAPAPASEEAKPVPAPAPVPVQAVPPQAGSLASEIAALVGLVQAMIPKPPSMAERLAELKAMADMFGVGKQPTTDPLQMLDSAVRVIGRARNIAGGGVASGGDDEGQSSAASVWGPVAKEIAGVVREGMAAVKMQGAVRAAQSVTQPQAMQAAPAQLPAREPWYTQVPSKEAEQAFKADLQASGLRIENAQPANQGQAQTQPGSEVVQRLFVFDEQAEAAYANVLTALPSQLGERASVVQPWCEGISRDAIAAVLCGVGVQGMRAHSVALQVVTRVERFAPDQMRDLFTRIDALTDWALEDGAEDFKVLVEKVFGMSGYADSVLDALLSVCAVLEPLVGDDTDEEQGDEEADKLPLVSTGQGDFKQDYTPKQNTPQKEPRAGGSEK